MYLRIKSEGTDKELDLIVFNQEESAFEVSQKNSEHPPLIVKLPFKTDLIEQDYLNLDKKLEDVYVFKNTYFSEQELIQLRIKEKKEGSGKIGFIFRLSALLDEENSIVSEQLQTFAFRSILILLRNQSSLQAKIPELRIDNDYSIYDFYDEDVILFALPHVFLHKVEGIDFLTDYLLSLFKYGFYFIDNHEEEGLYYNRIDKIKENFDSIQDSNDDGIKEIKISKAPNIFKVDSYFILLLRKLIKRQYYLFRFYAIYQVIEILTDHVLKEEISKQICETEENLSGYQIKEALGVLSRDTTQIKKLINDYCKIDDAYKSNFVLLLKDFFIQSSIDFNPDTDANNKIDHLIYKLRNNIVHNFKFLHEEAGLEERLQKLYSIIDHFEYLIIELLCTFGKSKPSP